MLPLSRFALLCVLALTCLPQAIRASDYDAVADWSVTANPSHSVWSYGYSATDGTGITLYTYTETDDSNRDLWRNPDADMGIVHNLTNGVITYNGGPVTQEPDELNLYPGNSGQRSILRWTAPKDGTWHFSGKFVGRDNPTSSGAYVVKDGDIAHPLAMMYLTQGAELPFDQNISLTAGETIDFDVDWGSNFQYSYDGTGLKMAIDYMGNGEVLSVTAFTASTPSKASAPIHFAATATHGVNVRVQSTTTPDVEASWQDLFDAGQGVMTESSTTAGLYTLDSAGYPDGSGIYFRAIAYATGSADAISSSAGPFMLHQPAIKITGTVATGSDPTGAQVCPGDTVKYTFTVQNSSTTAASKLTVAAQLPTYVPEGDTSVSQQFAKADIAALSAGGAYVAPTSAGRDAKVTWSLPTLNGRHSATVSYTVKVPLTARLSIAQVINDQPASFSVVSRVGQPSVPLTGADGGAALISTAVISPVAVTVVSQSSATQPGGLLTYRFTVSNQSSVPARNPVVVIKIPEGTLFDDSYTDPSGNKTTGLAFVGRSGSVSHVETFDAAHVGQLVIDLPALMGAGDAKNRDRISFDATFQTQWLSSDEQPNIDLDQYRAGFVTSANVPNPACGRALPAVTLLAKNLLAAPRTINLPPGTDFYALLGSAGFTTGLSSNASGSLSATVTGSLDGAPRLALGKVIDDGAGDTHTNPDDDNYNLIQPGQTITYLLPILNQGPAEAHDVFVEDVMPEHTSYVAGSARLLGNGPSAKASKLTVVPEVLSGPGVGSHPGQHLIFEGLQMKGNDSLGLTYSVRVDSGATAPTAGTFLGNNASLDESGLPRTSSIVSASTPHTVYGEGPKNDLQVIGKPKFDQPVIRALVPRPEVSTDPVATRVALDQLYHGNPNARPLTNAADPTSFIPGVERFYVHFANAGNVAVPNVSLMVSLPPAAGFYRTALVGLLPQQSKTSGELPEKILPTPASVRILAPTVLAESSLVTVTFSKLAAGEEGTLMVELIVGPNAVQSTGSLLVTPSATIADQGATTTASIGAGVLPVAHSASASNSLVSAPSGFHHNTAVAAVPHIALLKIAPRAVLDHDFAVTFVLLNLGDEDALSPKLHFVQPQNSTYVNATFTSAPNATPSAAAGGNATAQPGSDLSCTWDYIPAHGALAITYRLHRASATGTITDLDDYLEVPYAGRIAAAPSTIGVTGGLSGPTQYNYTIAGAPLTHLTLSQRDLFLVDLGNGNAAVVGPGTIVIPSDPQYIITEDNFIDPTLGQITAVEAAHSIAVGNTTADFLFSHANDPAALAPYLTTPAITLVPAGCLVQAAGAINLAAAGTGAVLAKDALALSNTALNLISQDGAGVISHDGGGLITQDGAGVISHDGGGVISHDGGGVISHDGGGVISHDGGGVISHDGGGYLPSLPGTAGILSTSSGGLVTPGTNNFLPIQ